MIFFYIHWRNKLNRTRHFQLTRQTSVCLSWYHFNTIFSTNEHHGSQDFHDSSPNMYCQFWLIIMLQSQQVVAVGHAQQPPQFPCDFWKRMWQACFTQETRKITVHTNYVRRFHMSFVLHVRRLDVA